MTSKLRSVLLIIALVTFFGMNQYFKSTTHMTLLQYIFDKNQLTAEDRLYLKEHGPIVYGSDNNSPPLRYYNKETEQYEGIVIDYLRALSIELETEILVQPMIWEEALEALKTGKTDICDMYPSKQRAEIYLFSDPIYYQRSVIVVPKQDGITQSVQDLNGKTVAVQNGDYVLEYLKGTKSDIQFVYGVDYEVNLKKLIQGDVDAIVGDEPVISYFLNAYHLNEHYRIVDEPLYELPSVLSLNIEDKRLQGILNKGIYSLTQKKIINKIQQKWFGISTPISNTTDLREFTAVVISVSLIAALAVLLFFIWNRGLKRAVDEQTRAIQLSKDNLQNLLDSLNQLIVVVSKDLEIQSGNQLFFKYFNLTPIVRYNLKQVITGISESVRFGWTEQLIGSEFMIKGRTFWVAPHSVQKDDESTSHVMLILEDITDKKVNESRLLQENKMAAIGQLATGVAHEIRNPLGLIRNYTFLLKRNPKDVELLNKALPIIEESVDKASTIIDNLLNFSRLSDDTISMISLKPLLENVIQLNEKVMNQKALKCQLLLKDVVIFANEESLKHIVINIVNNAIDAMPKGGHLTIWLSETQAEAVLKIIDTGIGMSQQTISRLFDPFFTTKNVGEGTGLGLYIAYNELNKIGGQINVISKPEKGSIFTLHLKKEKGALHGK